jgi:kynurenine formamidase
VNSQVNVPTEQEVLEYPRTLSNWGRWGADDQLGAVNFITDDVRRNAAKLVEQGVTVSLGLDLRTVPPGQYESHEITGPVQRYMIYTGQGLDEENRAPGRFGGESRYSAHVEWIGFSFHGPAVTHMDAFSHVSWDRCLFNGAPVAGITSQHGATSNAVTALRDGIFTRGVLVDVPRVRDVKWLEPKEAVFPEDLDAAEAEGGFTIGEGDAVILRTGYQRHVREIGHMDHFEKPGWHAACLPWLHERKVSVIGSDVACDVGSSGYPSMRIPVHVVCLVAMGVPILDECDLEDLAETANDLGRSTFLLTLAPLRIQGGTGSPVNPIAVF